MRHNAPGFVELEYPFQTSASGLSFKIWIGSNGYKEMILLLGLAWDDTWRDGELNSPVILIRVSPHVHLLPVRGNWGQEREQWFVEFFWAHNERDDITVVSERSQETFTRVLLGRACNASVCFFSRIRGIEAWAKQAPCQTFFSLRVWTDRGRRKWELQRWSTRFVYSLWYRPKL